MALNKYERNSLQIAAAASSGTRIASTELYAPPATRTEAGYEVCGICDGTGLKVELSVLYGCVPCTHCGGHGVLILDKHALDRTAKVHA